MDIARRNNVHILGSGKTTMVFAHGFGCDQNMWRLLAPVYAETRRVVLFDLVGGGNSDLSAYDFQRYSSLQAYADDLIEVIDHVGDGPVLFVGHSVSAMIGVLADLKGPHRFAAHVMVGPSPAYINDGDYHGGFTRTDIEQMLVALEGNYLGWSSTMAPAIMGAPDQPQLGQELTNSFCRTDPKIAAQFARVTFLSDNRADVARLKTPTLILQCSDDLIAPRVVGDYLHEHIADSQLTIIENVGHCPHLSAPSASVNAIDTFLRDFKP